MAVTPTTWNPSDKDSTVTLSGGNKSASSTGGAVRSIFGATSGKYYWEISIPSSDASCVGIGTSSVDLTGSPAAADAFAWLFWQYNGSIRNNGTTLYDHYAAASKVGILLDATAKTVKFQLDGVDVGSSYSITGSEFFAVFGDYGAITANFGASAFTYPVPSGYEAGFGAPAPAAQTAYPQGSSVFAFGAPTAIYGPNRTAQVIGAGLLSSGTATAIQSEDVTVYPQGNSISAFGTPSVIRGPNRTAQAVGGIAFSSGVHHAQLGYPASVTPLGVSVFSAGTPEALPYAAKILPVPGASVFRSGQPMAIADPIATAYTTVVAVGVSVFSTGTPTSASAAAVQVAGASVFKSGTATASPVANAVGSSVFRAGTPVAAQTARPVGVSVFSAGTPSVTMLAFPLGVSVFRAGTPRTGAAGSVTASGVSTFSAGTPRTSACVHARGSSLFRSGRPSIDRGATC